MGSPAHHPRFGDFELLEEIGRGGMGVVHRALHLPTGRSAAIKLLPSLQGLDPDAVARFQREAAAAARICHPGIVPVYGFGEHEHVHWLAMSYVEGVALDCLLGTLSGRDPGRLRGTLAEETGLAELLPAHRGRLDAPRTTHRYARSCARLCAEAAEALAAAHAAGVVHRDVKPGNLILDRRGRVVVVDFGLARDETGVRVTRSGDVVGTPCYMAPEQAIGGSDVDERADVYGIGATLFEMLTLRPPFDGVHAADILRRIVDEAAPPVRSVEPAVPVDLAALVDACLEKDPADRPATMDELRAALAAVGAGLRPAAASGRRRRRRALRRLRRTARRLALVATVAAAVGIALLAAGASARREAEQAAAVALRRARSHVAAGRFLQAEACYARAAVGVDEVAVAAARARHLDASFESLYARGEFAGLARWLSSWAPEQRGPRWSARLARAQGAGRLEVAVAGEPAALLRVRRRGAADVQRVGRSPLRLPIGDWIADVRHPEVAGWTRAVRIERDAVSRLELPGVRALPAGADAAPDAALVAAPSGPVWIERRELSRRRHNELLAGLEDPELRDELTPPDWDEVAAVREPELPLLGLAPRDAAVVAALCGGHVPTPGAHRAAGAAGAAAAVFPWGDQPLAEALPAAPWPVGSRRALASPLGVLDLVGNAGDLVLAPGGERAWLAGGDFRDGRPHALRLERREPWAVTQPAPAGGLRLARFAVPARVEHAAQAKVAAVRARLRATPGAAVVQWRIAADGRLHAALQGGAGGLRLPGAGAVIVAARDTADGAQLGADPERRDLLRWTPARDGGGGHHELLPVGLARATAGRVTLRLPVVEAAAAGAACLVELHTPPHARPLRVAPPADATLHDAAGLRLLWWRAPTLAAADRRGGLRVELRTDGAWTEAWPARATVDALLRRSEAPGVLDWEVRAVGALGPLWTAELVGTLRVADPLGRVRQLDGQPLTAWIDARTPRPELLRIGPRRVLDAGQRTADGYRNDSLGVVWSLAPGDRLARLDAGPWPLQIAVTGSGPAAPRALVTGASCPEAWSRWQRLEVLSGGVVSRPGVRLLSDPAEQPFGAAEAARTALTSEWLVPGRQGFWRERWSLCDVAGGSVLVRVGVRGDDVGAARRAFAAPAATAALRRLESGLRAADGGS